jgi:hypothetical protein
MRRVDKAVRIRAGRRYMAVTVRMDGAEAAVKAAAEVLRGTDIEFLGDGEIRENRQPGYGEHTYWRLTAEVLVPLPGEGGD